MNVSVLKAHLNGPLTPVRSSPHLELLKDNLAHSHPLGRSNVEWDAQNCTDSSKVRNRRGHWYSLHNHRKSIERLGSRLGIEKHQDWYRVKSEDFYRNGAGSLLQKYKGSPSKALTSILTEVDWDYGLFNTHQTHRFWDDPSNQLKFLDQLAIILSLKTKRDWYQVKSEDFIRNGGSTLLLKHGGSPSRVITSVYKDYSWDLRKFPLPLGYWNDRRNQREFMDKLAEKIGIRGFEDWYHVSQEDFHMNGGVSLLNKYKGSPVLAITTIYSEYPWKLFQFGRVRSEHWISQQNVAEFFQYLTTIQKMSNHGAGRRNSEPIEFRRQLVCSEGGDGIVKLYGSVPNALK